jgi:hypothetical protein
MFKYKTDNKPEPVQPIISTTVTNKQSVHKLIIPELIKYDDIKYPLKVLTTRQIYFQHDKLDRLVGITKHCDWYISHLGFYNITDTKSPKIIFLANDNPITQTNFIDKILPKIDNKFILIVAGQDFTYPLGINDPIKSKIFSCEKWKIKFEKLLNCDKIIKFFVENLDLEHPKLEPIPGGLCWASSDKYYYDILNGYEDINYSKKDIDVLCQHNIHQSFNSESGNWFYNFFNDRINFTNLVKNTELKKLITIIESSIDGRPPNDKDLTSFKSNCKRSTFIICIHGGGVDPCPKVLEGIMMGCIPIIIKSTVSYAYRDLPVVVIDEFDEKNITLDKLNEWYDKYIVYFTDPIKRKETLYKLSTNYWIDYIKSYLTS